MAMVTSNTDSEGGLPELLSVPTTKGNWSEGKNRVPPFRNSIRNAGGLLGMAKRLVATWAKETSKQAPLGQHPRTKLPKRPIPFGVPEHTLLKN